MPEISEEDLKALQAAKAERETFKAELEKLKAAPPKKDDPAPPPKKDDDDPELIDKAKKQREADDKKLSESKALESALRFSLKSEEYLKINGPLLPKDVADIFKQAESEKYSDPIQKDRALKSGIVQSFFKVQENYDLLTPGLKTNLDEYLKLTKDGKEEKAQQIYDNIFEPAFELLKRTKKAEALSKGHGTGDTDGYKARLIEGAKTHFLGGPKNA